MRLRTCTQGVRSKRVHAALALVAVGIALAAVPATAGAQVDIVPPEARGGSALSTTDVRVDLNEPLDPATVQTTDFILEMSGFSRPINAVNVPPDANHVIISSFGWRPGEAGVVRFSASGVVADPAGNANATADPVRVTAAPADLAPPVIDELELVPHRSVCVVEGPKCKRPGTTVRINVDEGGTVDFLIIRGRRTPVGTRHYNMRGPGLVKIRFDGSIRAKPLKAGNYKLYVIPTDAVGNSLPGDQAPWHPFTVVRRKGKAPPTQEGADGGGEDTPATEE